MQLKYKESDFVMQFWHIFQISLVVLIIYCTPSRVITYTNYLHSPGVQLMIFVMAGGAGNQNNKNPIWWRNLSCINNKHGQIY
jgi:hypothetical protein